ncbi:MAG: hypothetical protein ACRCZB_10165, partial [Bacteroidales bacterium]
FYKLNSLKMKNVFFEPWVGKNYQSGGIFQKKILVLGASHYCGNSNCASDCGKLEMKKDCDLSTTQVIKDYLYDYENCGDWKKTNCKFERSMVNKEANLDERINIWDSVVFYNYLQRAMDDNQEHANYEDYQNAIKPFFEVLEKYRPEKIIVWGTQLWEKLPSGEKWTGGEEITIDNKTVQTGYYTLQDGTKVEAMAVKHPSIAYSWDTWHRFIDAFIKR